MLDKKMGLWSLTALVVGNLVGSGVFMLPGILAPFGVVSLWGLFITSIGAILLALVFSILSTRFAKTGGPYVYIQAAFGQTVGYYAGFGYWVLGWISNAALVVAAVGYLTQITGPLNPILHVLLELSILVGVTRFNLCNIRTAGRGEIFITLMKVIPLIALPMVGIFLIKTPIVLFQIPEIPDHTVWSALNVVVCMTLWGFIGLETATVPGAQVETPQRTIPLAIIGGTLLAAFIYLLGTGVIIGVVPLEILQHSKAPYADAAHILFGGSWGHAIAIMAMISCIGALHGWTMIVGRIAQGLAEDKLLPACFAKKNKQDTPYMAILISSGLTAPFMLCSIQNNLLAQFESIVNISVTLVLVIYLMSIAAYFKILWKGQELTRLRAFLGMMALLFVLWALYAAGWKIVLGSMLLMGFGYPLRLRQACKP